MSRSAPLPNEVPVRLYSTPSWAAQVVDEMVVERVEYNKPGYVKAVEGSAHPDTVNFPNHKLIKVETSDQYGIEIRYYCNGFRNEDQYNYDLNYSGESNSHPIFSRRYLVRRDEYVPLVKGSTFTGIYLIEVTDGGSGYDPLIPPTVTIAGGGGAGATAKAVVSSDGIISWVYLTNEGTGYTSAPTVSFSAGTATATAKTQLTTGVVYTYTVTNGGAGYVVAPTITIGGTGSGATAIAQISGGAVVAIMPTSYGTGYTNATVTFSAGAATATANLQSVTPVLVKEDVQQFPEGDPRRSLYVIVQRQYEATPGPILIEHNFDPFLDDYISVQKSIVLKSTVPADMHYVTRTEGEITEYQPLTDIRYIKITSKINPLIAWENGGDDFVYEGTANFSFPDELLTADQQSLMNGGTMDWLFVWAFSGDNLIWDIDLPFNIKEGYSGPCKAIFTRRYTFDPEDAAFKADLPAVTQINPQAHKLYTYGWYSGGNLIAKIVTVNIPSTLHGEITLNAGGVNSPPQGAYSLTQTISATTPTGLPSGTIIVASVKPQQWKFGLWVYDIIEIEVP